MNSNNVVVQVKHVSKKFSRSLLRSMRYGIADIARNAIGLRARSDTLRPGEFWAIDDASFEIRRGETLGIIGANGSGKSTTLRMLNGIYMPDRGQIRIAGRVGALIELGAGFHPMLTGRENIYVNAAVLGLTKREVDERLDEIVEFADIGDFIDSPIKYYSSGMRVRLGFSVAMSMDPDVLLIDEVLSVGDASFRAKSYERMMSFRERGKTICFVSHDLMAVNAICDRVVWLDKGRIQIVGTPQEVIPAYRESQERLLLERRRSHQFGPKDETGEIVITKIETLNQTGLVTQEFEYQDRLIVRVHYDAITKVERPYFMVYVHSSDSRASMFNANMLRDGGEPDHLEGQGWLDIHFGPLNLYPGVYRIKAMIRKNSNVEYFGLREVASFAVVSKPEVYKRPGRFAATYVRDGSSFVVPVEFHWGHPQAAKGEIVPRLDQ